jgi:hypothetical protein
MQLQMLLSSLTHLQMLLVAAARLKRVRQVSKIALRVNPRIKSIFSDPKIEHLIHSFSFFLPFILPLPSTWDGIVECIAPYKASSPPFMFRSRNS